MRNVFFFLLLSFLVFGCSSKDKITIDNHNITPEMAELQNWRFVFSEAIGDSEEEITKPYLDISPKVNGKYFWEDAFTLVFSPAAPLPPATDFEISATKNFLDLARNKSGKKLEFSPIRFHTPYLQMQTADLYWALSNNETKGATVLKASLNFNYPINPKELSDKLSIEANAQKLPYTLLNSDVSNNIHAEIYNLAQSKDFAEININVANGLPIFGYNVFTKESLRADNLPLPDKSKIQIIACYPQHDGLGGKIQVVCNQQIPESNIKPLIQLKPALPFEVEITGNGFNIVSDKFSVNDAYTLTIDKKLKGIIGDNLGTNFVKSFTFGEIKPYLAFDNEKAMYLGADGFKNLSLQVYGIPELEVRVSKVFENNIYQFNRRNYNYEWYYNEEDDEYYDWREFNINTTGQLIYSDTIGSDKLAKYGERKLLHFDFLDKYTQFEGIYILEVRDPKKAWLYDARIIALSDIGLIAKQTAEGVYVFANSIKTANTISGASIDFISTNNQKLHTAITDAEGMAYFDLKKAQFQDFEVGMISARMGKDYNILLFDHNTKNMAEFETGGKRRSDLGIETYLYGERNIYRPGETMHLSGILRNENMLPPPNFPIILELRLPNGKIWKTFKKNLNDQGAFEISASLPEAAPTGNWRLDVLNPTQKILGSMNISVEAFMPDRIRFEVKTNKDTFNLQEKIPVSIAAFNYFGPPAAQRNAEVRIQLYRREFRPKKYAKYRFQLGKDIYLDDIVATGTTNAEGDVKFDISVPENYTNMGIIEARIYATVFDENGRAVHRNKQLYISTQKIYPGIGYFDDLASSRQNLKIPLIALNKEGQALNNVNTKIEIIRYDWRTSVEKSGAGYSYKSSREAITLVSQNIDISGENTHFSFTPPVSGEYEIRLYTPENDSYVKNNFYAYSPGNTSTTAFEVNTDGTIDISLDKEKYVVGEKANVLFKTPFTGKMLITLEQDDIIKKFYINTDKKSGEISFEVTEAMFPNCYITATLIKPHTNSEIPLNVAHGVAQLVSENPKKLLKVSIDAPEKSRSSRKQTIKVKTLAGAEVSVAIVDEGILALKNYQTPNPFKFFYQNRALEINSFDLYAALYPELPSLSLTGGDEDLESNFLEKRANPFGNRRVDAVSYWSGLQRADALGNVSVEIDIPYFSGALRVMAVAYKNEQFGSAEQNITISDPIVVSAGVPRFMSPGDTLQVAVNVSNTTDQNANGTIQLQLEGPLHLAANNSPTLALKPQQEDVTYLEVYADKDQLGEASITATVNALGEKFSQKQIFSVRPATPLQKISGSGVVEKGTETINLANDFMPASVSGKILLQRSPLVSFAKDLDYLVRYPYGCAEQTISSAFPQIYYKSLMASLYPKNGTLDPNPQYNVQQAVNKIQAMQLSNGGIAYWPQNGEENWWVSIYALHFLYEAKYAGYNVDEYAYKHLTRYINNKASENKMATYRLVNGQSKEVVSREIPYSLYVLTLVGDVPQNLLQFYREKHNLLGTDGLMLLAATYRLLGDEKTYRELMPATYTFDNVDPLSNVSFSSYVRDLALATLCVNDADAGSKTAADLARELSREMSSRTYLNTQERAFALLALGKVASSNENASTLSKILHNNQEVAKTNASGSVEMSIVDTQNFDYTLETSGEGKMYYFWEMEGLSMKNTFSARDNELKIRKTLYNLKGEKINPRNIKQNDMIVVALQLDLNNRTHIDNVVITDMLPGGFEIENPQLSQLPQLKWGSFSKAQHYDIRDDRIFLFLDAKKSQSLYYLVRAVSPGDFLMGPAAAEAMYQGDYYSINGAQYIRIRK
ncbi:MAG: MG2 domain-containing protein [Chitinophagales bacterium]|nr:hypothetical protein [Bacteroidota bacterium]MCB9042665.1 hypothetical protein [Chitinophagales bacterium]